MSTAASISEGGAPAPGTDAAVDAVLPPWPRLFDGPRGLTAFLAASLTSLVLVAVLAERWHQPGHVPVTLLIWLPLLAVAPVLFVVDSCLYLLPSALIYPALAATVATASICTAVGELSLTDLGTAAGAGALSWFLYAAIFLLAPPGAFGDGDVRLAALIGFATGLLGWQAAAAAVLLAPFGLFVVTPVSLLVQHLMRDQVAAVEAPQTTDANGAVSQEASTGASAQPPHGGVPYGPLMLAAAVTVAFVPDLIPLLMAA